MTIPCHIETYACTDTETVCNVFMYAMHCIIGKGGCIVLYCLVSCHVCMCARMSKYVDVCTSCCVCVCMCMCICVYVGM